MDSNEIDWVFQTDDEEVLETYRTLSLIHI